MQAISKLIIVAYAGLWAAMPVAAADTAFATVNGSVIKQELAEVFLTQAKANGVPESPEAKNALREELIRRELMFQAAKQAGFDKKPEVASQVEATQRALRAQAEAARQVIITRAYLDDFLKKHPVTEEQLKATYDTYRARGGDTEYKARHILVRDPADAKGIVAKLDKGARFEELAKQSIDGGSASDGGDLGWSSPAKFAKPFAEALTGLKKGGYTARPVKTEFGYHVIKLEDVRPLKVPSFAELKPMLQKEAEATAIEKMTAELRAKAVVK